MITVQSKGMFPYSLDGEESSFRVSMSVESASNGIDLIKIRMDTDSPAVPPVLNLRWSFPAVDVQGLWHPETAAQRGLILAWFPVWESCSTSSAPVVCLYSASGQNRHTFAVSDAMNVIKYHAGIDEVDSTVSCYIKLFDTPTAPLQSYDVVIRIDTRSVPYYQSLNEVSSWWASFPGYSPATVPEACRLPMYSTWYSFHKNLDQASVEEQCRLSREIGCQSIIMDDGWQTNELKFDYSLCGDWEVCEEKIHDMAVHVQNIHSMDMRYLLWYSVPFVGKKSKAWSRFKNQFLVISDRSGAGLLDPRYPSVREYLIETYENAVENWNLDGFKLDFIDRFRQPATENPENDPGRDYQSVPKAVDRLFTDIIARLRNLKPDIMVEFRQMYIGPLMRKYGNMFRAGDCANDALTNKIRVIDVRLLAGNTPVHSDMLTWHTTEPVEAAAMQILHILFSVPQISVKIDTLPDDHARMLSFLLQFWQKYRDVLLDGCLMPMHPELLYPLVMAENEDTFLAVTYADAVIDISIKSQSECVIVNATRQSRLFLNFANRLETYQIMVQNCTGEIAAQYTAPLQGAQVLDVPPSGIITLLRAGE